MIKKIIILCIFVIFISCSTIPDYPEKFTGTSIHKKSETINLEYSYVMYLPNKDKKIKSYPTIIYLHGAGQRSVYVENLLNDVIFTNIENMDSFPFIVIAPQATYGDWWDPQRLDLFLDDMIKEFPINPKQIYLTGYSMGGVGTWLWTAESPKRFAAIAPTAGSGFTKDAIKMKNLPIWVFHGEEDSAVPIKESEVMYNEINKINEEIEFTRLKDKNHDIREEVYTNRELYSWFLRY
ncbi:MAG: prolyl oligopeptidase family serine peptidase [Spirochaetaceae bacterium]